MKPEEETEIDYILAEEQPAPKSRFARYWERVGGGSFTISLMLHVMLALLAIFVIYFSQNKILDRSLIEFLTGGGGGTDGNTQIHKQRQQMMLNRAPSVAISTDTRGEFSLPNTAATLTTSILSITSGQMSGTPGAGIGFGGGIGPGNGPGDGPGTGPGRGAGLVAKFLGMDANGSNIIFCIDTSGSMRQNLSPEGISVLRRELKTVISGLPAQTRFNLICFGTKGDIFKKKSVLALPEHKEEAMRFLAVYYGGTGGGSGGSDFGRTRTESHGRAGKDASGIEYVPLEPDDIEELQGTEGGSRIDLAMVAAFERAPSTIYVLSDGAPGTRDPKSDGPMDKVDLINLIHQKFGELMGSKTKITVNTITIESDTAEGREGEQFMSKLAAKFHGKYKKVNIREVTDRKEVPPKGK